MTKRNIKYIVVHCTAGAANQSVWSLCRWFIFGRGWNMPGYHYVVLKSGVIVPLVNHDEVVNGAIGYNNNGLHIAYTGGVLADGKTPADTRTDAQKKSLLYLLSELHRYYPEAKICGHRDLPGVRKACPSFDVRKEYKKLISDEKE